jgi:hypothetical protein
VLEITISYYLIVTSNQSQQPQQPQQQERSRDQNMERIEYNAQLALENARKAREQGAVALEIATRNQQRSEQSERSERSEQSRDQNMGRIECDAQLALENARKAREQGAVALELARNFLDQRRRTREENL